MPRCASFHIRRSHNAFTLAQDLHQTLSSLLVAHIFTSSLRRHFYSCSGAANSKRVNIDQAKKQVGNQQLWTVVTTGKYKNRCSDVIPSPSEQSSGSLVLYNQSFPQTRASSISGASELLWSPRILPPKLKADSDDTVLRGIARKSRAIAERTGNFTALLLHQDRTSKSSMLFSGSSSK